MAPARDLLAGIMSPKKLLSGTTKLFTKKLSSLLKNLRLPRLMLLACILVMRLCASV